MNGILQPPQRVTTMPENGYDAYTYKAACAQDVTERPTLWPEEPYQWDVDEDCLYLNIWTTEVFF